MINKQKQKKILVIYGPNLNLLGLLSNKKNKRVTIDRLSSYIKKEAKKNKRAVTFIQSNSEPEVVNRVQRLRKKIFGIILFPMSWKKSGYVLKETLEILKIPVITISISGGGGIFKGENNIASKDIFLSSEEAINKLNLF